MVCDALVLAVLTLDALLARFFFFFNDTATTEIYTLSLHDALPIYPVLRPDNPAGPATSRSTGVTPRTRIWTRSEEHTSELQSRLHLVCRLLLEKKKENERAVLTGRERSTGGTVAASSDHDRALPHS